MKKEILISLNARRANLGLTFQELANRVHKDITTVKKQFASEKDVNMQLDTLCEYAVALNGRIEFISDDVEREINTPELSTLRQRMAELGNDAERLKDKLSDKDREIEHLKALNENLQNQLVALSAAVARKDEKLSKLIDSVIDLSNQVIKISKV